MANAVGRPIEVLAYGVDLGKNLFHVVGLDELGAVVPRVTVSARDGPLVLRPRGAKSGRHGSMPWIAVACSQAASHGAQAPDRACAVREAVREVAEERYDRCRGGDATNDALHPGPDDRADRSAGPAQAQGPTCQQPHRPINQARAFCLEYGVAIRQGTSVPISRRSPPTTPTT